MSILKGYKRVNAWGEGVPGSKILTRREYRSQCPIGTLVHPHTRSARNTQLGGNTCLVCCFLWLSTVNWSSFSFFDIPLSGWPLGECPQPRKIGEPDSKDHWALSVQTEVCWFGCPQSFMQQWHIYIIPLWYANLTMHFLNFAFFRSLGYFLLVLLACASITLLQIEIYCVGTYWNVFDIRLVWLYLPEFQCKALYNQSLWFTHILYIRTFLDQHLVRTGLCANLGWLNRCKGIFLALLHFLLLYLARNPL